MPSSLKRKKIAPQDFLRHVSDTENSVHPVQSEKFFEPSRYQKQNSFVDLGHDKILVVHTLCTADPKDFALSLPPDILARRLVRMGISGIASRGATPLGYTHTITLPKSQETSWLRSYHRGLQKEQQSSGIKLLEEKIVPSSQTLTCTLTILGQVRKESVFSSLTALKGDKIFVTGPMGDAYLGSQILRGAFPEFPEKTRSFLTHRYITPDPRLQESLSLNTYINGGIQIAQGLFKDLKILCENSHQRAFIDLSKIPLSPEAQDILNAFDCESKRSSLLKDMLMNSPDYELILTIAPDQCQDALFFSKNHGVSLYPIGLLGTINGEEKENPVTIVDEKGNKVDCF